MPTSTASAAEVSSRLLIASAVSRLTGENTAFAFRSGARQAKSANEPPMVAAMIARMKTPRSGSLAKAWTEVRTPERTRNVPSRLKAKASSARNTVQAFIASRRSQTMALCNRAAPASQGSSEAFSTGSQNQKPPQPSS